MLIYTNITMNKFGYSESGGLQGPRGLKGEQGDEGPQGPPGVQGKGINTITYDDPNDQLVITYDDATTSSIPFPGVSLDTTANIRAYGTNNTNKLLIEQNDGTDILIVNTFLGTTNCGGSGVVINTGSIQPSNLVYSYLVAHLIHQ